MKVVLFAGGKGTRISEESYLRPKPMIEIGGYPILWHIMKIYSAHRIDEFVICLGYKGYMIKEYFINYFLHHSDLTVDLQDNSVEVHKSSTERFKITLVDTGLETLTAGRLKRVRKYLGEENFMLTYGDGVTDVNVSELLAYHQSHGKLATMTAVQSGSRFGIMDLDEANAVRAFVEKPKDEGTWINAGYFVLSPGIWDYLRDDADEVMWEGQPLEDLARDGQLVAYKHSGFWKCMDTLRDKNDLEKMWQHNPPWKIW